MQSRNISDIIERYLKDILAESKQIEIKRSEIAERFDVVPSQINYVIKTRFNIKNGYIVKSKRGGGGYIRISKMNLINNVDLIDKMIDCIGTKVSMKESLQVIRSLYEDKFLNKKEVNLILCILDNDTLAFNDQNLEDTVRARILISILNRLRCEE